MRGWHEVARANVSKCAPIPRIKFPIDCEHEWEYRGPHYQWASTQVPKTGLVKVPAGTFKAVNTEDTPNGFKVREEHWYASGVGLVQIGENWPSRTLKSFTPGDGKKPQVALPQ
ncbi:hypothetical protein VT84_28755 [Gemmata sp. SH-PL17]|uniref:hypothetical protein n=1 Tax=Gemmata sp. SH-PL17 TaxID=1630693 RepID=UPI0006973699|nr:hypothetical protein [Gemmata sp. SH-PL17]AMV28429.1 hypothetical protein VT84_28755 [Gemmata sp. SH-PL17]